MTDNYQLFISPKDLYPTENFGFNRSEVLKLYLEAFKREGVFEQPQVFNFEDNYYILKGHHIVLAAIIAGIEKIKVELIDTGKDKFWSNEQNIIDTLKVRGISTLYDFEAIGNFTYSTYPKYYE